MTQVRARLLTWTDSLPLPDGDRALLANKQLAEAKQLAAALRGD